MTIKSKIQPEYVRWFGPLLEALQQLGGKASPSEAIDKVAELEHVPDAQRNVMLKSGEGRFANQVRWARQYLAWRGFIDASKRGVWELTSEGLKTKLSLEQAHEIFLSREKVSVDNKSKLKDTPNKKSQAAQINVQNVEQTDIEAELELFLDVIRNLSPGGFERICMRVLREAGFERLKVTGKSNDGGIDGIGVLQINDLVKFNVVFQCKKWINPVPPKEVRDLRGAMTGSAEKAIFLTTSVFTQGAKEEALRVGTNPIELVDGEKLLELFKKYEIGLKPRTVYDIDQQFFEAFEKGVEQ